MSIQYGRWSFDGRDVASEMDLRALLAPYGPDGEYTHHEQGFEVRFGAFHTTERAAIERQPIATACGALITWDGRLDNRDDVARELQISANKTDGAIVAAAYDSWKMGCFAKLIGDWAVSIWEPNERSLILARDFVGLKHLYYSVEQSGITWSSLLDALVLNKDHSLDEEYIAGWLASLPAPHLTPYAGIHAVPPGCFTRFTADGQIVQRYWEFDGSKRIRYATDGEYEEHFRKLFRQAVTRRLRASAPVLAELSGGMDSCSIVCMADEVAIASDILPIDTVSYYNRNEPNWNEEPYFTKVEEHRGKTGLHIDAGCLSTDEPDVSHLALTPGSIRSASKVTDWMNRHGHRVLLSGIGGDEFLGGVPTPVPELEDLLSCGRFIALAKQLKAWSLQQRRPWIHLFRDSVAGFLPLVLRQFPKDKRTAVWLHPNFARRYQPALRSYEDRWNLFGPLPSFQENLAALDTLRRQVAASELNPCLPYEKRYPFLDRDLLEFLFAIPREQLVRPGERRSLMRRSLKEIVPSEILSRRCKAYVTKSPLIAIRRQYERLITSRDNLVIDSLGVVTPDAFFSALEQAIQGKAIAIIPLLRALNLEQWLRSLKARGFLDGSTVRISSSAVELNLPVASTGA